MKYHKMGKQIFERIQYLESQNKQLHAALERSEFENRCLQEYNQELLKNSNQIGSRNQLIAM